MDLEKLTVIVLAAGRGKRFGESYTKLLHPILGKPLIYYPIQNLRNLKVQNIFVVVSDTKVEEEIRKYVDCQFVYQTKLLGTADAVKLALSKLSFPHGVWEGKVIMVLNGDDATLYSRGTLDEFLKSHQDSTAQISMMTMKTARGMEVGRVIRDYNDQFSKILEYKEYLESGVKSNEINCGIYLINLEFARTQLPKIPQSPNGEYYLTDLLNLAREKNEKINLFVLKDHSQWIGINDKHDLKYAEGIIKKRVGMKKTSQKRVHFLGIAGSGTSACANIAQSAGFIVTGCDRSMDSEFAQSLSGIETFEGHSASHLENIDVLAVTPAVLSLDPKNPEILEAKRVGVKIMTWQKFMGQFLARGKFVIAISGTHGKSTTTAMLGKILDDSGFDPTVLLGAKTSFWKSNFRIGKSKYFLIEADEFNDNFMSLKPNISVVTNIEFDHPEYFKDFASYKNTFQKFLQKTKNLIIANLSDKNTFDVLNIRQESEENLFPPVLDFSKNLIDFPLKVIGSQNMMNASAAFNLGLNLEISPEKIKQSLKNFPGISRRMEYLGEINQAKIFSDFAHHPTAIKITIEQFKKQYPDKKIWLIYQPHMFSRTKALFKEFVKVFKNLEVENIYMLDIYPSREIDTGIIKIQDLIKAIGKDNIQYIRGVKEIFGEIKPQLTQEDVVIFMGAGDIDSKIRKELS